VAHNQPRSRESPLSCQRQLITVREVPPNHFQPKGKEKWSLGAPFARWFTSEEEDKDDMEGASVGGVPSRVVKFTGSNRVMTVSELRNLVY
jgi:hypothetical protein